MSHRILTHTAPPRPRERGTAITISQMQKLRQNRVWLCPRFPTGPLQNLCSQPPHSTGSSQSWLMISSLGSIGYSPTSSYSNSGLDCDLGILFLKAPWWPESLIRKHWAATYVMGLFLWSLKYPKDRGQGTWTRATLKRGSAFLTTLPSSPRLTLVTSYTFIELHSLKVDCQQELKCYLLNFSQAQFPLTCTIYLDLLYPPLSSNLLAKASSEKTHHW